jgi:hypothetical protein
VDRLLLHRGEKVVVLDAKLQLAPVRQILTSAELEQLTR